MSDAYGVLLAGEAAGIVLGASVVLGASGALNPYLALAGVFGWAVLHLTARASLRERFGGKQ